MAISVVAALALEALLLGVVVLSSHFTLDVPDRRPSTSRPVTLRGLSAEQWQKNRGPAPKVKDERTVVARNRDEPKKPEPKPEVKPTGHSAKFS